MNTTQHNSHRQTFRRVSTVAVLFAAIMVGIAIQPPTASVAEDLVVLDPPNGFTSVAADLGFGVSEETSLENLSLEAFRLQAPAGTSGTAAIALLRAHYPNLEIAGNSFGEF